MVRVVKVTVCKPVAGVDDWCSVLATQAVAEVIDGGPRSRAIPAAKDAPLRRQDKSDANVLAATKVEQLAGGPFTFGANGLMATHAAILAVGDSQATVILLRADLL
jgi:hypothetical protein